MLIRDELQKEQTLRFDQYLDEFLPSRSSSSSSNVNISLLMNDKEDNTPYRADVITYRERWLKGYTESDLQKNIDRKYSVERVLEMLQSHFGESKPSFLSQVMTVLTADPIPDEEPDHDDADDADVDEVLEPEFETPRTQSTSSQEVLETVRVDDRVKVVKVIKIRPDEDRTIRPVNISSESTQSSVSTRLPEKSILSPARVIVGDFPSIGSPPALSRPSSKTPKRRRPQSDDEVASISQTSSVVTELPRSPQPMARKSTQPRRSPRIQQEPSLSTTDSSSPPPSARKSSKPLQKATPTRRTPATQVISSSFGSPEEIQTQDAIEHKKDDRRRSSGAHNKRPRARLIDYESPGEQVNGDDIREPKRSRTNKENTSSSSGKRVRWSHDEEKLLILGVNEFGAGAWKRIRDKYFGEDSKRSYVDLKDKWRNMEKYGKV
jgi:hypothetical protein